MSTADTTARAPRITAPRLAHLLVHGCYLNLWWLLACAPVVTAPAATAALHRAVDRWTHDGDPPTVRSYATDIRATARDATLTAILLLAAAALLLLDLHAIGRLTTLRRPMLVLWLAAALNLTLACAFTLAATAHETAPLRTRLRHAAAAGYRHPHLALTAAAVPWATALLIAAFPAALLGAPVAAAVTTDRLWRRARHPQGDPTTAARPRRATSDQHHTTRKASDHAAG